MELRTSDAFDEWRRTTVENRRDGAELDAKIEAALDSIASDPLTAGQPTGHAIAVVERVTPITGTNIGILYVVDVHDAVIDVRRVDDDRGIAAITPGETFGNDHVEREVRKLTRTTDVDDEAIAARRQAIEAARRRILAIDERTMTDLQREAAHIMSRALEVVTVIEARQLARHVDNPSEATLSEAERLDPEHERRGAIRASELARMRAGTPKATHSLDHARATIAAHTRAQRRELKRHRDQGHDRDR